LPTPYSLDRGHPDVALGRGLRVGDPLVVARDADAAAVHVTADTKHEVARAGGRVHDGDAVRTSDDEAAAIGKPDRKEPGGRSSKLPGYGRVLFRRERMHR